MKARFAAILIALCLLVAIVGFSSSLSGVPGISVDEGTPPPDTATVPPNDSPTTGPPAAGTTPARASADTGAAPAESPTVTPTEYIEQDPVVLPDTPSPAATSRVATVPTPVPSTPAVTERPEQAPSRAPDSAPMVSDRTETGSSTGSAPARVTVRVVARDEAFTPSSITVPAGAEVTIVFENEDVDILHNVVIYADRDAPLFVGTIVRGPGRTTDTFTAPSEPGKYALGCGVPTPHRMGTFIVE